MRVLIFLQHSFHINVAFACVPETNIFSHCYSGMLVQDPTKGNNSVDDFFNQARQSAVDVPPEYPQKSKSFTGTARLLSGETVQSAPSQPEVVTHTITFWRNGFSVDDGPLRRLDDPQNAPFLEVNCSEE